jgi:uncharacterized protein with PQ loop repeat
MWYRDTKWAHAVGKMAPKVLLDAGLPQTFNLYKKKFNTKILYAFLSSITRGLLSALLIPFYLKPLIIFSEKNKSSCDISLVSLPLHQKPTFIRIIYGRSSHITSKTVNGVTKHPHSTCNMQIVDDGMYWQKFSCGIYCHVYGGTCDENNGF